MPKFVSRSIKRKLTMITLLISCVVLFLVSVIFVTTQVASYRRAIVQELETITTIIGSNSTAAVVFDDRRAAEEILAALRAKPNIVSFSTRTVSSNSSASTVQPVVLGWGLGLGGLSGLYRVPADRRFR